MHWVCNVTCCLNHHACHPSSCYGCTVHCLAVYLSDPTVTNPEEFIALSKVPLQTPCLFAGCIRQQQHPQTGYVCCFCRAAARTGRRVGQDSESRMGWIQSVHTVSGGAQKLDRQGELGIGTLVVCHCKAPSHVQQALHAASHNAHTSAILHDSLYSLNSHIWPLAPVADLQPHGCRCPS